MSTVGIKELSLDALSELIAQAPERGIYESLFQGLLDSDAPASDVTDRFVQKGTKLESVYQGFRGQLKGDNAERFSDLGVIHRNDQVVIYKKSALNGTVEETEENDEE